MNYRFLECKNCGASLTFDPASVSMKCAFCDSLHLIEFDEPEDFKALIDTAEVLFFDIKLEEAKGIFSSWLKKGFFQPGDFTRAVRDLEFEGIYIPFFAFRADASSSWNGRDKKEDDYEKRGAFMYGQIKHEMKKESRYRSESWEKRNGGHSENYRDLIGATKGLTQFEVDMIMPYDDDYAKPFDYRFLLGYKFERPAVKMENARDRFKDRIREKESYHCAGLVDELTDIDTKITFTNSHLMLLPIWVVAYRYGNKTKRILINGQNGKLYGEKPVSRFRVFLFVAALLAALVTPLVYLLT